jgi:hypothetical protein
VEIRGLSDITRSSQVREIIILILFFLILLVKYEVSILSF